MSFKEIIGQDKPIAMLKEFMEQSCVKGGYLFSGPEGIGKYMAARTLAKALNCQDGLLDSCDKCSSCLKIEKGLHPDVHLINAPDSDAIKIEFIRQMQKEISLKPYEARIKVFVIDNAHNLTAEASNALLKILEEPSGNSLIILVTSKPALLFKTVISRCKVFRFQPLERPKLRQLLENDYHLQHSAAHYLAYFTEGRIGSALKLKDTDILEEKKRVIDGFIFSRSSDTADPLIEKREEFRHALNILAAWFRDLYLAKAGIAHSELINLDRKNELLGAAQKYSFPELDEILKSISDSLLYIEQNINLKLLISNLRMTLWKN